MVVYCMLVSTWVSLIFKLHLVFTNLIGMQLLSMSAPGSRSVIDVSWVNWSMYRLYWVLELGLGNYQVSICSNIGIVINGAVL